MNNKELIYFVEWLPENSGLFEGMTIEETVSKINELSTSDEGKQTLEQLTKRYKGMELFKKGGKLHQLLCFKSGGKAPGCGCNKKIEKGKNGVDKVVEKRNDGVNGSYSRETLNNGTIIEQLSRRNPDESVTYTERQITPRDTSYYMYNNTTPPMDRYVISGKYVTPTKYNNMGWLGKRIIAGVRPDSWDAKFDSYQEPINSFQPGGSIANRLWNKWTGKDKYEDGYGVSRSHTPVRESAHRTIVKAADSPLVQAIPVVGDIADGYVAADYATKGNYLPAAMAVATGLLTPDAAEVGIKGADIDDYAARVIKERQARELAEKEVREQTGREAKTMSRESRKRKKGKETWGTWYENPAPSNSNVSSKYPEYTPRTSKNDEIPGGWDILTWKLGGKI